MKKKLISIIITTYNSEKYIERTLNSIINQKGINIFFNIELIVVDDCSKDNTLKIIKKYNPLILSTKINSGGPNKGRNLGLKIAKGDFICIVDHDDQWKNNKIIDCLPFLEKVPIVTSGYTLINKKNKNDNQKRVNTNNSSFIFFKKNQTFLKKLSKSLNGQNTYLGSIIYSKKLKHILFEEHFGMIDFDWILRIFHQNESIEICKSLYNRNVYNNNLSLNEDYRAKDFYYSLFFIEKYENLYPKETKIGYKKIHGSRARYFYLINKMKKARFYFLKSQINIKTIGYYITTFVGASYVRKKFNIFG